MPTVSPLLGGLPVHLPKPLWPPPWVRRLGSVQPDPLPSTHLFLCLSPQKLALIICLLLVKDYDRDVVLGCGMGRGGDRSGFDSLQATSSKGRGAQSPAQSV